jgi:uncharacterized protein
MPFVYPTEPETKCEVKRSRIPNTNMMGLFAKQKIEKDEMICWYGGVFVEKRMIDNDYYHSDYTLTRPGSDLIIDAEDPMSCLGRWANDGLSFRENNADFGFLQDGSIGFVYATKNIRKGAEIYAGYGHKYWTEPRRYALLTPENQEFVDNMD